MSGFRQVGTAPQDRQRQRAAGLLNAGHYFSSDDGLATSSLL